MILNKSLKMCIFQRPTKIQENAPAPSFLHDSADQYPEIVLCNMFGALEQIKSNRTRSWCAVSGDLGVFNNRFSFF